MDTAPATAGFREFARLLGCQPGYVTKLRKDGRLVLTEDNKRVRVAESRERIHATRDPAKAGVAARHAAERAAKAITTEPQTEEPAAAVDVKRSASGHDLQAYSAPPQNEGRAGSVYQESRAVRERYMALAAKRDYEESMRRLLVASEVEAALLNAGTTLRTALENIPDTLAPALAAENDEGRVRVILGDALEHALGEIARTFTIIVKKPETNNE